MLPNFDLGRKEFSLKPVRIDAVSVLNQFPLDGYHQIAELSSLSKHYLGSGPSNEALTIAKSANLFFIHP